MVPTGHSARMAAGGDVGRALGSYRLHYAKHTSNPKELAPSDPMGSYLGPDLRPVHVARRAPWLVRASCRAARKRARSHARDRQRDRTEPDALSTTARAARAR